MKNFTMGKGHGGLYKVPTKEEGRKRKAKGRGDQIKFIDLRFESWQVVGFRGGRRQDVPYYRELRWLHHVCSRMSRGYARSSYENYRIA